MKQGRCQHALYFTVTMGNDAYGIATTRKENQQKLSATAAAHGTIPTHSQSQSRPGTGCKSPTCPYSEVSGAGKVLPGSCQGSDPASEAGNNSFR